MYRYAGCNRVAMQDASQSTMWRMHPQMNHSYTRIIAWLDCARHHHASELVQFDIVTQVVIRKVCYW
jgi:hypothetical protein